MSSHPAIQGLAVGINKGFKVTKNVRPQRQSRHKGRLSVNFASWVVVVWVMEVMNVASDL